MLSVPSSVCTPEPLVTSSVVLHRPVYCVSLIMTSVLFCPSAIYNYDPSGEQELRLQVGDTVHILEKLEGE